MNWDAISFDWNQARAFLATAQEGSLSAAARALGQSQPTVGRQINALEETLGVLLFDRIGTRLRLNKTGQSFVEPVQSMAEAACRVSMTATGLSQKSTGTVTVTAIDSVACYLLPDILADLRKTAPDITCQVIAANSLQNLLHREADIALRYVRPTQTDLISKMVHETTVHVYATPAYLAQFGPDPTLKTLKKAHFIGLGDSDEFVGHLAQMGLELGKSNFGIWTQSSTVGWEMVKKGLGLGVMLKQIADKTPEVVCALPDLKPISVPLWLVTHRELLTNPLIRTVFDHFAAALAASTPARR